LLKSRKSLAADQGRIAEFAGKSLNDIVLDQQEEVSAEANGSDSSSAEEEQECSSLPTGDTQADIRQPMAPDSGDSGKKVKKTRSMAVRKKWTESEKESVRNYFASDILNHTLPSKKKIQAFLNEAKLDRTWTNIKDHIRNQYLPH